MRSNVRPIAIALVTALVVTALTTSRDDSDDAGVTPSDEEDTFPLSVSRPELAHVADQDLRVAVGVSESQLRAGDDGAVELNGADGTSGMVRVLDDDENLAGMAVVPKDEELLAGLIDDGPLDVPVDYRSTAFGLFATQPFIATADPGVTTLLAAIALELPEFDALVEAVETAAAEDPAYLDARPEPLATALDDLVEAFEEDAGRLEGEVATLAGDSESPATPTTTPATATTVSFRGQPANEDSDGCELPAASSENSDDDLPVIEVDPGMKDKICITSAEFKDGAWHITGESHTPRWAFAKAANEGVPSGRFQLVPGKALALPTVEALAKGLVEAVGLGFLEDALALVDKGLCELGKLFGGDDECEDLDESQMLKRLVDLVKSYFAPAEFDFRLLGSEEQTVLTVSGLGGVQGVEELKADVAGSWMVTIFMTVVVPTVALMGDVKGLYQPKQLAGLPETTSLADGLRGFATKNIDMFADLTSKLANLDFGGVVSVMGQLIEKALDLKGLVWAAVQDFFEYILRGQPIEDQIANLVEQLANPLKKIDLAIGVTNAIGTVTMLAWDIPQLSTSVRYGLGYTDPADAERPPDLPDDVIWCATCTPSPNPPLPEQSCGLRVALVVDHSNSIFDAGGEDDVRSASIGLVDALAGTPTTLRISSFAGGVRQELPWSSLADPDGREAAREQARAQPTARDNTNFEAAFRDLFGHRADLVVFVTDGEPIKSFGADPLMDSIAAANLLKENGSRVVAVGVGDVQEDTLWQISGHNQDDDYYYNEDFESLGSSLAAVATEVCGTSLTIEHLVDGQPTGGADYALEIPDEQTQPLVTASDGFARLALEHDVGPTATVQGPSGLPLEGVRCGPEGEEVPQEPDENGAVTVDIDENAVHCTFEWRAATGAEAISEIARGPGTVRFVSFEPQPGGEDQVVLGCLDQVNKGEFAHEDWSCRQVQFGVSFEAGYAVMRHDGSGDLRVTEDDGAVRFQFDNQGTFDISPAAHLDMTVRNGSSGLDLGSLWLTLDGTLLSANSLSVEAQRRPPLLPVCIAKYSSGGTSRNRAVATGEGC